MRTEKTICHSLFYILWFLSVGFLAAAEPKNLALEAKASASPGAEGSGGFDWDSRGDWSHFVNDGDPDTYLGFPRTRSPEAWIGLTWPQPVTFREVLIRQDMDQELDQVALQVRSNGQWRTVKTVASGPNPLAKLILITVDAQTTDAIRLTDFKGTPGFGEVEVYEGPTVPVMNLAGDAAGHIIGILTDAFGAAPLARAPVVFSGRAGESHGRP